MPKSEQRGGNRIETAYDRPPETAEGVAMALWHMTRHMPAAERRKCLNVYRECLRAVRGEPEGDGTRH